MLLLALNVLIPFTAALRGRSLIGAATGGLSWPSLAGYRLAAGAVSFITPGPQIGGEPLLVLWLVRRHGLAAEQAIAAVALDRGIELALNFGVLAWGLSVLIGWRTSRIAVPPLAPYGLVLMALLPLLYGLALRRGNRPLSCLASLCRRAPHPWRDLLIRSERFAGTLCRQRPAAIGAALVFSVVHWGFLMAEFWFVFFLVGRSLTAPELLIVLGITRCAFLTPLPGGVGALEAALVIAAGVLAFPPVMALAAAALIRARDFLVAATGLALAARYSRVGATRAAPGPSTSETRYDAELPD